MAEKTDKEHRATVEENDELWIRLAMAGVFDPRRQSRLAALQDAEIWDMLLG